MPSRTVFISYSHKDKDLLVPLVAQLKGLEQAGLLDVWVDTRIDAGDKWYPDIESAMKRAAVAVCLVSEYFLASDFCTKQEIPFILKRASEDGLLIIPLLISDCPWYAHRWVEERQMIPGEGQSVRSNFSHNPAGAFSRVAKRIFDKLNDPNYQPPICAPAWPELPPEHVDLTHLPETGAALFGRDRELELLDAAWGGRVATTLTPDAQQRIPDSPIRLLISIAQGGVGKSTLINHWLDEMRRDNFRGARRVFGWSFYSQGVCEQGAVSADSFTDAALRFFGDSDPDTGSPWDKGERLARLVGTQRALLVLDGLEPLQSAHTFNRGKLRDPALEALLQGLVRNSDGLCLITTREPLTGLSEQLGVTALDLEQITPQAGRALLRTARVVGTDADLEALAERFGPHALAVSLLGVYLHGHPGHGVGPAQALEQLPGPTSVDRVLAGFEQWLGASADIEALSLLGFFDRPADDVCLQTLRALPAIPNLTDQIAGMSDAEWNRVLARLQKLRLISVQQNAAGQQFVDAHPLIREYFANQIRTKKVNAWQVAHQRLYEMFLRISEPNPQRLEQIMPFYRAVAHGCQAGLHNKVLEEVYRPIIQRGQKGFAQKVLGAGGEDLAALSWFFERPWTEVIPTVHDKWKAWLPGNAGSRLRALTRLQEAVEPTSKSLDQAQRMGLTMLVAIRARQLSELQLILGDLAGALYHAAQAVCIVDTQDKQSERIMARVVWADALHAAGFLSEAKMAFQEAEELQRTVDPEHPLLYSLWGFRYCDLLLHQGLWAEVLDRESKTANWPEMDLPNGLGLLDVPLGIISLVKCHLAKFDAGQHVDLDHTVALSETAIGKIRNSGKHDFLPLAYLTGASALRRRAGRHVGDPAASRSVKLAEAKLAIASEVADRCGMLCFQVDTALEGCQLAILQEQWVQAREMVRKARECVINTQKLYKRYEPTSSDGKRPICFAAIPSGSKVGYWRQNAEIEALESLLCTR